MSCYKLIEPHLYVVKEELARGYTGHEHLTLVSLIHMNGRLYDPQLHRFLSPDNFVQDPYNTQNYNRYGYVLNNPLKYTDPSGEIFGIDDVIISGIIIGAMIAAASYTIQCAISPDGIRSMTFMGFAKAVVIGAASGAATAGIGNLFAAAGPTTLQGAFHMTNAFLNGAATAIAHGISQSVFSVIGGAKLSLSSFGAAVLTSGVMSGLGAIKNVAFKDFMYSIGGSMTIGFATGGIGAVITGGDFWTGACVGALIAGANTALHRPWDVTAKTDLKQQNQAEDSNQCSAYCHSSVDDKFGVSDHVNELLEKAGGGLQIKATRDSYKSEGYKINNFITAENGYSIEQTATVLDFMAQNTGKNSVVQAFIDVNAITNDGHAVLIQEVNYMNDLSIFEIKLMDPENSNNIQTTVKTFNYMYGITR